MTMREVATRLHVRVGHFVGYLRPGGQFQVRVEDIQKLLEFISLRIPGSPGREGDIA